MEKNDCENMKIKMLRVNTLIKLKILPTLPIKLLGIILNI